MEEIDYERDYDKIAGDRLASINDWLIAINVVLIVFMAPTMFTKVLTIGNWTNRYGVTTIIIMFFLILSLWFLFTTATCLASPYYKDNNKQPPNPTKMVKFA